jgi:hypothetical protein
MGYTDKQGRPELIAKPFISRGPATYRTVSTPSDDPGDLGTEQELPPGSHEGSQEAHSASRDPVR